MDRYRFDYIKEEISEYKKFKYFGVSTVQIENETIISIVFGDN